MANSQDRIEIILNNFSSKTKNLANFLTCQQDVAKKFKDDVKHLYDITKQTEAQGVAEALPELIVENFDDEQVWQELELQNEGLVAELVSDVATISASKKLTFSVKQTNKRQVPKEAFAEEDVDEESGEEGYESDDDLEDLNIDLGEKVSEKGIFSNDDEAIESEEEQELEKLLDKATADDADEEADTDSENEEEEMEQESEEKIPSKKENKSSKLVLDSKDKKGPSKRKTVVDDKFFSLADMEAFVDREDAKEERKYRKLKSKTSQELSSEGSDEDIDFFADDLSSEDEVKSGKQMMYSDFFDPVEGSEDPPAGDSEEDDEEDESSEGEEIEEIFGGAKKDPQKSSFEKRQEKLKEKISELEAAALQEKPWQLAGEVSSSARPENSLLQEHLDYEQTTKAAPVITEETTMKLEDIIKQRIKDNVWDDVERKVKLTEEAREYKKRAVLDQEKSKLSLGEIYEKEYLQQMEKEEVEKEDPDHNEIKKMMTSLFVKLDALSNFHFTPKPAVLEVKVVNNLPSVTVEEVAPTSVSDAALLAPEEVQEKQKGELTGASERTETDKKRARREKKKRQRAKQKQKEKKQQLVEKMNPGLGNKYSKEKAMRDLEAQSKLGKSAVTVIKDDGKRKKKTDLTSSTKFFQQLQDEVKTQVRAKRADSKKKKTEKQSSKKFKL